MTHKDAPALGWRAGSQGLWTSLPDSFFCDCMTEGKRQLSHWHQHCLSKSRVSCLTTQDWEITRGKDKLQLCTSAKWPHFKVSFQCCCSRGSCHYLQEEHPLSQNCSCSSLSQQILRISRWTLRPETLGSLCGLDNQETLGGCLSTHWLLCSLLLHWILAPAWDLEGHREHHWDLSATPCWESHLDLSQADGECSRAVQKNPFLFV